MSLRDWWWRPERGFGFEEADNGGPSATGGCYTWLYYIELKILGRSAFDSAPGEPRSVRPATQSSPAGFLCGCAGNSRISGPICTSHGTRDRRVRPAVKIRFPIVPDSESPLGCRTGDIISGC
jgi:hypothetical protein